jgi:hypothetical protein
MNDPFQTRLNEMKQQDYLRQAEEARLAAQAPGWRVRWWLAQGLMRLALRVSPLEFTPKPPLSKRQVRC